MNQQLILHASTAGDLVSIQELSSHMSCGVAKKKKNAKNKQKKPPKQNMMRYHFPSYQISKIFKDS